MRNEIQELAEDYILNKNDSSFSMLVTKLKPRLMEHACSMLKSDADAEDVVMSVLEDFWRRPDMYDRERSRFMTWIYTVLNNRSRKFLYSKNRKFAMKYVPTDMSTLSVLDCPRIDDESPLMYKDETGTISTIDIGDVNDRIYNATIELMEYLPSNISVMMKEKYLNNKDVGQIVREYGKPESTVRYYLNEGERMLGDMVRGEVPEYVEMATL